MRTLFEIQEEMNEMKLYFLRQKLYGLLAVILGVLMIVVASKTVKELNLVAIVIITMGLTVMLTRHKALG